LAEVQQVVADEISRFNGVALAVSTNGLASELPDGLMVATTHGLPRRYDTYIPIAFAGKGIPAQKISRRVEAVDITTTLSLLATKYN
jgi:hypothetical protein